MCNGAETFAKLSAYTFVVVVLSMLSAWISILIFSLFNHDPFDVRSL